MGSFMASITPYIGTLGCLNAFCLMLFCLLYVPCAATIGTIHRESRSWKFTCGMLAFQLVLAWGVSVVVFQVGSLILR